MPQRIERDAWPKHFNFVPKVLVIESLCPSALLSHVPDNLGQYLIMLLQRLEDRPHFIRTRTGHRFLNGFSFDLFKEQRHQYSL